MIIRTLDDIPRALQRIGLLGAGVGLLVSAVFEGRLAAAYSAIALVAVAIDVCAIWSGATAAVVLAGLKLVVAFLPLLIFVTGGAPGGPYVEPVVPHGSGVIIVIASAFPSLFGAIGRHFA